MADTNTHTHTYFFILRTSFFSLFTKEKKGRKNEDTTFFYFKTHNYESVTNVIVFHM